jgi:hypothetical protein
MSPILTIAGNNRRAVLRSAARTRKLGGYWHQSSASTKVLKYPKCIHVVVVDRIERRKG